MKQTWHGGSFAGDLAGYVEEGSGNEHLSLGTPLGNLERDSFTGDFERWMRRVSLFVGSRWGPVEGDTSIGNFGKSMKEGSGCRVTFCTGALLGERLVGVLLL